MSTLEELMPELAGVLAAQEGALENVVSTLTTQVQALLVANSRQARQVAQLESTQHTLRETIKEIQNAPPPEPAPAPPPVEAPVPIPAPPELPASFAADTLATLSAQMREWQQGLQQEMEQQIVQQVERAVAAQPQQPPQIQQVVDDAPMRQLLKEQIQALSDKMHVELDEVRADVASRVTDQSLRTEEAIQRELDQLEKRFEYLSRTRMEVKELVRTSKLQEQGLEDMRVAIEMLAKSIGTDDTDEDEDDEVEGLDPSESKAPKPASAVAIARRNSVLRSQVSMKMENLRSSIDVSSDESDGDEKVSSVSTSQCSNPPASPCRRASTAVPLLTGTEAAFRRSKSIEPAAAEEVYAKRDALTARGHSRVRTKLDVVEPAPTTVEPEWMRRKARIVEPAVSAEASALECVENQQPEAVVEAAEVETPAEPPVEVVEEGPPATPPTTQPEVPQLEKKPDIPATPEPETQAAVVTPEPQVAQPLPRPASQQAEGERTTETVKPSTTPIVVPAPAATLTPAPVPTPSPTLPATLSAVDDTDEEDESNSKVELPPEYRNRVVSQQKHLEDQLDLFRPSPSSTPPERPASQHAAARARRQERSNRRHSSMRKDSDVQPGSRSPMVAVREIPRMTLKSAPNANVGVELLPVSREISTAPAPSVPDPNRPPLTKERIHALWHLVFTKLVRLQRLQQVNGINAERSFFRRQNMSMGTRVRRLEESTADLDDCLEQLEGTVMANSAAISAMDDILADLQPAVEDKFDAVESTQKLQAKGLVDIEEKMEALDVEIRRLRSSSRRNSSMGSGVTTAITSALTAQFQDLSTKFTDHVAAFQTAKALLARVADTDVPALQEKLEQSTHVLKSEFEYRVQEATKETHKALEQIRLSQHSSEEALLDRTTAFQQRICRALLTMSSAMLQSTELTKTALTKKVLRSPLDVGIELLQGVFSHFMADCEAIQHHEDSTEIGFMVEKAADFHQELDKLKVQAAKSRMAAQSLSSLSLDIHSDNNSAHDNSLAAETSQTSSCDDHLVFLTATQLRTLEGLLAARNSSKDNNSVSEFSLQMHDLVAQVRAVLFMLLMHAQLLDPHRQLQTLRSSQALLQSEVSSHGFSIGQLGSTIALVKMMNTRLDSFMELSFAYAKDEDVKKSIQDMIGKSNDARDQLVKSLEATRSETLERDELLEKELTQLVSRVNKKLDKDELLWTQEVLERKLQNVANSSLDEHDLMDIHRRLRHKVDKAHFGALLQGHRGSLDLGTSGMGSAGGGGDGNGANTGKNAPLVGTKCISCQGELPPSKAMIKNAVREEVHHELARSRAQHCKLPSTSSSGFNASSHRHMEKHRKELLLAALQQKNAHESK